MARRVGRSRFGQELIGFLLASYLRFVQRTSRITTEPDDLDAHVAGQTPLIGAMWHGQHLMMSFARPKTIDRIAVLISRHEDAGAQAAAVHLWDHADPRLGRPDDRHATRAAFRRCASCCASSTPASRSR